MLEDVTIKGYRSIRQLRLPLRRVTVVVGANGTGKTNLYRALALLQGAATGTLGSDIAREGGMTSAFWAGGHQATDDRMEPGGNWSHGLRHDQASRIVVEARLGTDIDGRTSRYSLELGFPAPGSATLPGEAVIKRETLTSSDGRRDAAIMDRKGPGLRLRNDRGAWHDADIALLGGETALSVVGAGYPEIDDVRQVLAGWRFYHGFRTDPGSPLRAPSLPVAATQLDSDGSNLGAVFATLAYVREDTATLDRAIDAAFPGATLSIETHPTGVTLALRFPQYPFRPFSAPELSDGTLQFLALAGALLSYRPPPLIVLNEPEASLHPDILPVVADMIGQAARTSQILVVTHSTRLANAITAATGAEPLHLYRDEDGTAIRGLNVLLGQFDDE